MAIATNGTPGPTQWTIVQHFPGALAVSEWGGEYVPFPKRVGDFMS